MCYPPGALTIEHMKVFYKIEYKLDKEKWSHPYIKEDEYEWHLYEDEITGYAEDEITSYDEAVSSLTQKRDWCEKSENFYVRAHVFRLVKVIQEEEVLDV